MITTSLPSKRRGKIQQQIATGNLPEKRNLTGAVFSLDRKAYQNPIRKETVLVQTSRAAVISGATPFSIPIRYSSFNLNANNEALKFTPRSGSMPRIVGEEPGDYGDREAILFHQKKNDEEEKNIEEEIGEAEEEEEEGNRLGEAPRPPFQNTFTNNDPGENVAGLTEGAENAARLADLAYKGPDEADLTFFTERGYVLDDDYSTDEHIVIVNPDNREVAIGIRGTAFNLNNMLTDATIAFGNFPQSERARKTLELRDLLRQRYPDFQFHFAGHSMGGTAAAYAAEGDPNAVATTFNAGSTPFGGAIESAENVTNYRTEGDAISQGIANAITIPKQCNSSLAHSSSQFVPGAPCEKPGFTSFVKNSLEAAANTAAKVVKTFSPLIPPEINVPLRLASKGTSALLGEAERQNRTATPQERRKRQERREKIKQAGEYRKLKLAGRQETRQVPPLKEEQEEEEPYQVPISSGKPFGKTKKEKVFTRPVKDSKGRSTADRQRRILQTPPDWRPEAERPIVNNRPIQRGTPVLSDQQARGEAIALYGSETIEGPRRTRSGKLLGLGVSPSTQSRTPVEQSAMEGRTIVPLVTPGRRVSFSAPSLNYSYSGESPLSSSSARTITKSEQKRKTADEEAPKKKVVKKKRKTADEEIRQQPVERTGKTRSQSINKRKNPERKARFKGKY